jgi:hypothetical protein
VGPSCDFLIPSQPVSPPGVDLQQWKSNALRVGQAHLAWAFAQSSLNAHYFVDELTVLRCSAYVLLPTAKIQRRSERLREAVRGAASRNIE